MSRWQKAAQILIEAKYDLLAYMSFPIEHWKRVYSNGVLERLHKEVRRKTNVVGVLSDELSVIRMVGAILQELDDEWAVAKHSSAWNH